MSNNNLFNRDFISRFIRERRDNLLINSDKYMIPDFPITDEKKEEWKEYRKKLRDITIQESFEDCSLSDNFELQGIEWPTKPN